MWEYFQIFLKKQPIDYNHENLIYINITFFLQFFCNSNILMDYIKYFTIQFELILKSKKIISNATPI